MNDGKKESYEEICRLKINYFVFKGLEKFVERFGEFWSKMFVGTLTAKKRPDDVVHVCVCVFVRACVCVCVHLGIHACTSLF